MFQAQVRCLDSSLWSDFEGYQRANMHNFINLPYENVLHIFDAKVVPVLMYGT